MYDGNNGKCTLREIIHLLFLRAWVASAKFLAQFLPTMSDEENGSRPEERSERPTRRAYRSTKRSEVVFDDGASVINLSASRSACFPRIKSAD